MALTSSDQGGAHHAEIAALIDNNPNFQRIWAPYLAESWAVVEPAAAFRWVLGAASPNQRENAVAGVLDTWRRSDPAAARSALQSATDLSDDVRSRLLEKLPEG
jgi:hypothetical protein